MKKLILTLLVSIFFTVNVSGATRLVPKFKTITFKHLLCDRQNEKNIAIGFVKSTEKNYLIENIYCYNGYWAIDLKHKK